MSKKYTPEWWSGLRPERVGKETETLVEGVLNRLNASSNFAWHRFPDSKSSRGLVKAQPADYIFLMGGTPVFLEVKALKHLYRLPSERVSQLPVLKKFQLAGARGLVLVHHYLSQTWRIVPVDELEFGVPSWSLSEYPTYRSAEEALFTALALLEK